MIKMKSDLEPAFFSMHGYSARHGASKAQSIVKPKGCLSCKAIQPFPGRVPTGHTTLQSLSSTWHKLSLHSGSAHALSGRDTLLGNLLQNQITEI